MRMETLEITWQDCYKLPLQFVTSNKVLDAEHNMAFDFAQQFLFDVPVATLEKEVKEQTLEIINGDRTPKKANKLTYEGGVIFIHVGNEKLPLLVVRGWGYLTGQGGLNLSPEQAATIQDDFARHIISKLTTVS